MATNTITAVPLDVLPDGRLRLGDEALPVAESTRLRSHLAYGDGTLPAHVGLRETASGGREVWRIEDGAVAAIPLPPATEYAQGDEAPRSRGGFGIAKGRYIMTPDFDDPLPEFAEYL